ncbi:hypothetical protein Tco_0763183 [Tanacetum coccineum]
MEILTLILQRRVRTSESFRYHKQCEELQITNVCFAYDLFILARGDVESARVIMESLNEFKQVSMLIPSISKSTAFFCNVVNQVKMAILNIMPFTEGELPVKYLGVPLISSRLLNKDCKVLVEQALYWAFVLVIPMGMIGNGMKTSIWYDMWCSHCPLIQFLSPRDITREVYSIQTCVADLLLNGAWNWPQLWLLKAPNLGLILTPNIVAALQYCMMWYDSNGHMKVFSVKCAWEVLHPCGNEVAWNNTI